MDKNKSRTDLLAAGKKKLQQFRQKKDGKGSGSHGKSTKKSGKSEKHGADSVPTAAEPTASSEVPGGEIAAHVNSDSSVLDSLELHSMEKSVVTKTDVSVVDPSNVPITPEANESVLAHDPELTTAKMGVCDREDDSVQNEATSTGRVDAEVAGNMHINSDSMPPKEKTEDGNKSESVDSTAGETSTFEPQSVDRGDLPLPSEADTPKTSLLHAIEDQEADGLDGTQSDHSHEVDLHEHTVLPSDLDVSAETFPEIASLNTSVEASSEVEQSGKLDEVSISAGRDMSDGFSASALALPELEISSVSLALENHQRMVSWTGSFHEGMPEMSSRSGNFEEGLENRFQDNTGDSAVAEVHDQHILDSHEGTLETNASPTVALSSVSLSQLTNLIRVLSEEDYRLLLKSRKLVSNSEPGTTNSIVMDCESSDLLERLKEELFLTNLTKDIFQLQLSQHSELQVKFDHEHHQLAGEMSQLSASLNEVCERNQCLTEELAQCRSELEAVTSGRMELESQLNAAKVEVGDLSAGACELQNSLERSERDLLSLSSELADLKNLVETLKVENESLNETIISVTEEKKKCLEENEKFSTDLADCRTVITALQFESSNLNGNLSLVSEDKKKLEAEKEHLFSENDKLSTEMADCKGLISALQMEIDNLKGSLALLTEEREKVEEVKKYSSFENERLSSELLILQDQLSTEHGERMRIEGLISASQIEIDNLKGSLALVTEEREKLEEDNKYSSLENERLSSELLILQEQLSTEHGERTRVEVDLKEVKMRVKQLMEENASLTSSLDMHKATLIEANNTNIEMDTQLGEAGNQVEISELQSKSHENATACEDSYQIVEDGDGVSIPLVKNPQSDSYSGQVLLEEEVYNDSFGFVALKRHLEEVERVLNHLEKAIEGVYYQSTSFSRSGGKSSAPGVSKLIQAFESKVHLDDHVAEDKALTENLSPAADPFMLTNEHIANLRALFEQLVLDAANASITLKVERDSRENADATSRGLSYQYEALREHSNKLEANVIELEILYEAVKQHGGNIEAANSELVVLSEAVNQQVASLKAENSKLVSKLHVYESRIDELQSQLSGVWQNSNEMASEIYIQLEILQKEVDERVLMLEQERNSTFAEIVEIVRKLDESVGNSGLTVSHHDNGLDMVSLVAASVNSATKVIGDIWKKLEAARSDHEAIYSSYREANKTCDDLQHKNDLAVGILQQVHGNLRKLLNDLHGSARAGEMSIGHEKLLDFLDYSIYKTLLEQLHSFLSEKLELESVNEKLNSESIKIMGEFEELSKRCLDSNAISKLMEDVEGVLKLEDIEIDTNASPASRFELLVSILIQKYKAYGMQVSLSKDDYESKVIKLDELQDEVQTLIATCLQYENEVLVLREGLSHANEALSAARSELQVKVSELEQSEQQRLSTREKLSIAVAKGKGLVVQRDSLKQSLAETSNELERCLQDLNLKDVSLHEVEAKLKAYSEAGERVEALESELSYIRNSATGLRESFLLKDSVLQRIEEILEDLDLPEHFHSRDIIEKIDWLARTAAGNPLPLNDWDQKSSAAGGSYADAGFVGMEPWKDDGQLSSNAGEDLKRKYEELESKFYGLAEQNEMLEQSLMERNNMVQRWEELLDRIDMPSHLHSVEPEDRIEWLGSALSEAHHDAISLQQKVGNFENYCASLTSDLEDSQRRISDLETELQAVILEKDSLSERLEILKQDLGKLSSKASQFEDENKMLQNEVARLQENVTELLGNEKHVAELEALNNVMQEEMTRLRENVAELLGKEKRTEDVTRRLQDLICDALHDPGNQEQVPASSGIECLEILLSRLIHNYVALSSERSISAGSVDGLSADATHDEAKSISTLQIKESDIVLLKKDLEEALHDLMCVEEERDGYVQKLQNMACEIEALDKQREELQLLLNQGEQKSVSLREKLNVAVRKGKLVVQQRDSLKQTIDEMNTEMEHLKSEINIRENKLSEYELKFRDLSIYPERVEALESETLSLRNQLTETECYLQETRNTMSMILAGIGGIDVSNAVESGDPIKKLEQIAKLCVDLRSDVASSEQESRKSRRAAELLLAELNEVQERNDGLQEDLAKGVSELAEVTKERELAEAAKLEALSRFEELYKVHSAEQTNQFSEFMGLKSGVDQLSKGVHHINNLLINVLNKDLEILHSLETGMNSCILPSNATDVAGVPHLNTSGGLIPANSDDKDNFSSMEIWSNSIKQGHFDGNSVSKICSSVGHQLQELMIEVGVLKEKLHKHSGLMQEQGANLFKVISVVHKEFNNLNESCEAVKRDIIHVESTEKEKDKELVVLRKNIALLLEAFSSSVAEIESRKAELLGKNSATGDLGINLTSANLPGGSFSRQEDVSTEESIRTMADELLLAVRGFSNMKAEIVEGSKKEMKITIADLQKELQEKEIQKERICMDLVQQIKEAEVAATRYSQDLHSSRSRVLDLEKEVEVISAKRNLLEQRVNELQCAHATSTELQDKVRSLTDVLAAKDQEIEALMQALDEEEMQMEGLTNKIEELKKVVQQKDIDLENLEASRGKVVKKLSITVAKFDELHHLSASLLAEVENLQSQLQDRDAEISFLRQEVTRCTNDALAASQLISKKTSDEIHEFLIWFDTIIAKVGVHNLHLDSDGQFQELKEVIEKKVESIISELEDLREVAQSKDTLLLVERNKVEELMRKEEMLQKSLFEKESQLNYLEGVGASGLAKSTTPEIVEVEPVVSNWKVPGTSSAAPQVRSLRKGNNDQVAVAIDVDPGSGSRFEDEDDDKVHGFKSLTTSKIVPRFTRPVTDMIDGLWVSCDRTLMRRPVLRLGIILYWAVLHSLLAAFAF